MQREQRRSGGTLTRDCVTRSNGVGMLACSGLFEADGGGGMREQAAASAARPPYLPKRTRGRPLPPANSHLTSSSHRRQLPASSRFTSSKCVLQRPRRPPEATAAMAAVSRLRRLGVAPPPPPPGKSAMLSVSIAMLHPARRPAASPASLSRALHRLPQPPRSTSSTPACSHGMLAVAGRRA